MKSIENFTNQYPLSKTLRFELIPQGKTLEFIEKNGLLIQDEIRAESYVKVKKIIDEYHKFFISNALKNLQLDGLDEYSFQYQLPKHTADEKKIFSIIQANLRKQIAESFTQIDKFKNLFSKELIKYDLKTFVKTDEEIKLVEEFDNFTTYFTGFHENRKNMYSAEDKSTAIAFRLIHQNLPKFLDNMRVFDKIRISPIKEKFPILLSELEQIIQVNSIEEMFQLDFFNSALTQRGITVYNILLGGYSEEGKVKIKGLNEYINLYNQTAKKEERIGKLKPLYKQILSDRLTASYIPEQFESDEKVLESIEACYQEINEFVIHKKVDGEHSLVELISNLNEYDLYKVYLKNDLSLTDISQKMFGDWGILQKAMDKWYTDVYYRGKSKPETEKYEEEQKKYFRNRDSFSIGFLNDCLLLLDEKYHLKIEYYFADLGANKSENDKTENLFILLEKNYREIIDLLNLPYSSDKDLAQNQYEVEKIKVFLDSLKAIQWFIKPLLGAGNEAEKDEKFSGEFSMLWTTLDQITPLYNKVRNYMTRKPYSTEKMKLNFENSTLLDGWDVNKESDNTSVILRKDGLYYLAIMDKKNTKVFKKDFENGDDSCYEKMEYKLLPGANKMLPKVFFSKSRIREFNPSDLLLQNYRNETHKKGENFNLKHCHELIDFFKHSINKHEDWKHFNFNFSDTKSYEDLSGFYREVEQQGYNITYKSIPDSYINSLVEEGKLYLFQIYNKDFSPNSKGTPNLHTLYWKMLFDADNLKDVVYKLNGQAEVFYRKSSIKQENIVVHKANQSIANKNDLNEKKQSLFDYDIIKDRRFTIDKFQFHVPITMNFKAKGLNNLNLKVNEILKEKENNYVIGIDRGERHLLYLTLIDSKGLIIEQFSLNEIVNEYEGKIYKTNYHDLLDKREGNRDEARKNWKTIETIKELKEGYLSQVIHKISELMIQYDAIVVLEDLNLGFMRGRQKVEKQVYQKFEKMLIDKLNYLVDKKQKSSELGGSLKAYQLTNKFESFQKLGKQSGFLFYIPAWNTSKMDPVTGFVNLFNLKYENIEKTKSFFEKFDSIHFNSAKNWFEFSFDYLKFTNKAEGTKTKWTICTNKERIETFRNASKNSQWDNREIVLTDEFMKLFDTYEIDFKKPVNLIESMLKQSDKAFYERLLHLFKLSLQMRNSITNTETDYLISPVANEKGEFFDSRLAIDTLPKNADANGAYNIARKGLWAIEQIKKANDLKKVKLAISNKEWLGFAQNV